MEVRGRDMVSGLPKTITISSKEIHTALKESLEQILETIRVTLENCPPELSGDIVDRGIVLTGGGSQLNGMKEDRKSTRLNSSHVSISYAVFCLKKPIDGGALVFL